MENTLGALLRSAREAKGLTQAQVGERVGITYSAVGQYESGSIKRPKPERVAAIAALLEINPDTLSTRMMESYGFALDASAVPIISNGGASPVTVRRKPDPPREVELAFDAPPFSKLSGPRDVEERGIAVGGENGDFTLNGEVVGYVTRPLSLVGRRVFAVRVKGSSMHPRFDEGDILYVEENREPAIGDDGIFEMKPTDEWEAGHAFVKQLVAKGMGIVKVRQFNPADEFSYRREEIARMFRVVPRNELVSV